MRAHTHTRTHVTLFIEKNFARTCVDQQLAAGSLGLASRVAAGPRKNAPASRIVSLLFSARAWRGTAYCVLARSLTECARTWQASSADTGRPGPRLLGWRPGRAARTAPCPSVSGAPGRREDRRQGKAPRPGARSLAPRTVDFRSQSWRLVSARNGNSRPVGERGPGLAHRAAFTHPDSPVSAQKCGPFCRI